MCNCENNIPKQPIIRQRMADARETLKCCEQGCEIKPGEQYIYSTELRDQIIYKYYTCLPCANLKDYVEWISDQYIDFGYLVETMKSDELVVPVIPYNIEKDWTSLDSDIVGTKEAGGVYKWRLKIPTAAP